MVAIAAMIARHLHLKPNLTHDLWLLFMWREFANNCSHLLVYDVGFICKYIKFPTSRIELLEADLVIRN